jgi:beta-N-acetylhexosaminidase
MSREPEQVAEVCLRGSRLDTDLPPWVSVDQEGGRVARLKAPFTEWPPMATLGGAATAGWRNGFARALARELKRVGFTLDYAPVLDVHDQPEEHRHGDRALADNPKDVARLGADDHPDAAGAGIAACGKHFPGMATHRDSHHELPLVEHPPERLREVECVAVQAPRSTPASRRS